MKVHALLQAKGSTVVTVDPGASVRQVVAELSTHNIGALVVSGDGRTVEGIVSERDVVAWIARSGPSVLDGDVRTIMRASVTTCRPDDVVADLMRVMTERRIRHLPVVDGDALAGMVSIGDVVKARVDELEVDRDRLHDFINAR